MEFPEPRKLHFLCLPPTTFKLTFNYKLKIVLFPLQNLYVKQTLLLFFGVCFSIKIIFVA